MSNWSRDDLDTFGAADEIGVSSLRPDGSTRPFVTVWIVRLGDSLFLRSASGPQNGWFRRARASGLGQIRAGSRTRDVTFEDAAGEEAEALHAAYHAKYRRYGKAFVSSVASDEAAGATLRLRPR